MVRSPILQAGRGCLVALFGLAVNGTQSQTAFVNEVRMATVAGDFSRAQKLVDAYRGARGVTTELILADSWMGRGLLDAGQLEAADKHAAEVRAWAQAEIAHRPLDADAALPEALGAAIEVHAKVLAKSGAHTEAVAFLKAEAVRWRATSIRPRIQKNLNLLTLEGRAAPPWEVTHWAGPTKPVPLSAMQGHPVLLFFWAHWCVDCKAEASIIQDLSARYGPLGLKVVGPTMRYGYAAGGEEATPEQEDAWIAETWKKYYARIGDMTVPISAETMQQYGVSTTPTLVLVDRHGIVRLYHPGLMSLQELAPRVAKLLEPAGKSSTRS